MRFESMDQPRQAEGISRMTDIRDGVESDTDEWQRKCGQDGRRRDTGDAVIVAAVAVAVAAAVAGKRRDECVQKGEGEGDLAGGSVRER